MSSSSAPRALFGGVWEASARRGGDVVLPCLVHANPPPAVMSVPTSERTPLSHTKLNPGKIYVLFAIINACRLIKECKEHVIEVKMELPILIYFFLIIVDKLRFCQKKSNDGV